ncbi:hypothetical protein D918_00200 [Trichuris suis]|nr:hypothetical protein D918_00200 [Trichuris suis]
MEDKYSSVSCFKTVPPRKKDPEISNSVKDEVAKVNLNEDDDNSSEEVNGFKIHGVVKDHIFHSSFFIDDWYVRLIRLYENRETENGLFVKFSLAPSLCSSLITISLEQLYSSSCPVIQNDDWMLCSGIILNRTVGDYRITCRGIIRSESKKKDGDKGSNVTSSTVVSTSIEVVQVTTVLKRLIFAEVMEFNGWYARVVELRTLKREESSAFVEFTIAPSKCNIRSQVSFDQLYSNVCPIDIDGATIICKGSVFYNSNGKHTIQCGERKIHTPLPSEFPALVKTVEISEHSTHEEITVVLQNLLTEKKIETSVHSVNISSLLKVEKQTSFAYVEFIAAPAECDPSAQDPKGQRNSTVCSSSSSTVVILCKGNIPYSPNEKHNITCTEMERDDPRLPTLPPHVIPGEQEVQEFEETQEIITSIKEFIIDERITIDGHQAWLDKVIRYERHAEAIEMEFSIVDIFCGQPKLTTTHGAGKDSCRQRNAKKKAVCNATISLIPGIRNTFKCTLPKLVQQRPGETTPADNGTEITASIKRLLVAEKIAIDGHHVRLDTLISQRRVKTGLAIEFTITDTSCDITEEMSLKMIYSESCTQTDPSRPSTPEGTHTDMTTDEGITNSVKEVIFTEVMTIRGRHARVHRLIKYEKLTTGVQVEFSISETTCDGRLKISLEQIYSPMCAPEHTTTVIICKGILPFAKSMEHTIRCSGGDKLTEVDPSTSPSDGESSTVIKTINYTEVVHKVERLVFVERMIISGYYVRVDKVTKYERTTTGVDVIFIIIRTKCTSKTMITIDQLYSSNCAPQSSSDPIVCKGILPFEQMFLHQIKCAFTNGTEIPLAPTPESSIDVEVVATEEVAEVTTQIRQMMFAKKLTINNQQVRLDTLIKHTKVETGTEVEFTVIETTCSINEQFDPSEPPTSGSYIIADPSNVNSHEITISIKKLMYVETMTIKGRHVRVEKLLKHKTVTMGIEVEFTILRTTCDGVLKISLEQIYSDMCAVTKATKVVVCKGLLPFQSVMKHSVRCSRGDKLSSENDPWTPSTDVAKSIEYSQVLRFVERFVFIEKMSISDHYVRVDELSKREASETGMDVIFTVITTTCTTEQRLTLEELYSSSCPPERFSEVVVCSGTLPFKLTVPHTISCIFSNGTATPLSPIPKRPEESEIVESTEMAEITTQIKELIINERLTVRGQRAQLDMLILHRKVENGIKVQFTIVESACSGNIQVEPSQPSTPGSGMTSDPATVSKEQITISIKRLMFSETMTINGNHVRVEKLNKVETVASGVLVEFTIAETTCKSRLKIRLETIYSKHCKTVQSATLVICKGLLPQKKSDSHTIRCSGGDKLTEGSPSSPSIPSEGGIEQSPENAKVLSQLKLLVFHKRLAINGAYARVSSIQKTVSVAIGTEVKFTITQTVCRSTLRITLEELYSRRCRPQLPSAYQICKGLLPSHDPTKHSIECGEEDEQTSPSDGQTGQNTQIVTSIKRLIQTQSVTINGRYASFHKLIRQTKVETGIEVEFSVTDPVSDTEVDPSRPSTPGDTTTETATIEKITKSVKEFIFMKEMTIRGRHTRVEKLIEYEMVSTGVRVEFSIYETTCDGKEKIPLEEIYSALCPRADMTSVVICKGILSISGERKHTITCSGGDKLTEKPDPSIPSDGDDSTTSAEGPEYSIVLRKVKRLVFIENTIISGYYARVDKLTKYEKVTTGIDISFTIRQTTCTTRMRVTIDQLYSTTCAVQSSSDPVVCKGILPFQHTFIHHIKCFFNDGTEMSPTDGEVIESAEMAEITTQIKTVMLTKKLTINGQHARLETFITHKRVESGIEVEFTITETTCSISSQYDPSEPSSPGSDEVADPTTVSTERVIISIRKLMLSETMTINGNHARVEKLISHEKVISGVQVEFSLVETTCSGKLKIDPSQPTTPGDKHTDTITTEIITISVKEILFVETMTIKGRHARVEKLVKYQKVPTGVQVEFSIFETICDGTLKIPLAQLYSTMCSRAETTTAVICKGVILSSSSLKHTIKCSGGDKLTEDRPSDPSTGGDIPTGEHAVEYSIVLRKVERLVFIEKMTISGYYVRVVKLTKYAKATSGIDVMFTIKQTTCTSHLAVTIDQLYSSTCSVQTHAVAVVCRGILPFKQTFMHRIKCFFLNGTETPLSTKPTDVGILETPEVAQVTAQIKRVIMTKRLTVNGQHARFDTLISQKKVTNGIEVEFTITDTSCNGNMEVTEDELYGQSCARQGYTKKLICKAIISITSRDYGDVKCSEEDDVEQKVMFSETMTISGHHVRVEKLIRAQKVTSGVFVEFTILETSCSSRLRLKMEMIYSHRCKVVHSNRVVRCNGILPMPDGGKHSIRCSAGDKLTDNYDPEPSIPTDSATESPVQTDKPEIMSKLRLLTFVEKFTIRGHYVRIDSLKTAHTVPGGTQVVFTITATVCSIRLKYLKPSLPTPGQPTEAETAEIKKIASSIKRLIVSQRITVNGQSARFDKLITHKRTQFGIEIEFTVMDPRSDSTGGTDPWRPSTPGSGSVTDPTTASSEEITISVQRLMFHETMTINGYHVRVERLTRRENVNSALYVEFTIAQTTCSGRLGLTMESVYSHRCPVAEGVSVVVCKGFLPSVAGGKHTIICSGGDKLTQLPTDSPFIPGESVVSDATNRTHVAELLKKVIYFDRTYLRGYYPRLVSLSGFERASHQDLEVQFSIAASNCSSLHQVSLEQLYTDICPVNECCSWLTCTGTLPLVKRRNYNIRCIIAVTFSGYL